MNDKYECRNCGCTNMAHEDVMKVKFAGNFEEPAEYEAICPECGSDDVKQMSAFFCRGCGDVPVQNDGDYCDSCLGEIAEARTESMKDSEWGMYDG